MPSAPQDEFNALERQLRDAVARVREPERTTILRSLALDAAELCGVAEHCRSASDLAALVQTLDEQAWDIQAEVDEGQRDEQDYVVAFQAARAANSWLNAVDPASPEDGYRAAYEAVHALGGDQRAYRVVIDRFD